MLSVWLAVTCLLSALSFARWSVSMPFARCNLPSRFVFGHAIWHDKSWMVPSCQLFIRIACQCSIYTASAGTCMHACMCALHAWLCDVTTLAPQDCLWGQAAWARPAAPRCPRMSGRQHALCEPLGRRDVKRRWNRNMFRACTRRAPRS